MSLGGIATYVALLGLIVIWITPWVISSLVLSGLADIEARESLLLGLLLGPLSLVLLALLIINRRSNSSRPMSDGIEFQMISGKNDPFA